MFVVDYRLPISIIRYFDSRGNTFSGSLSRLSCTWIGVGEGPPHPFQSSGLGVHFESCISENDPLSLLLSLNANGSQRT
jgi:hypothetical protein